MAEETKEAEAPAVAESGGGGGGGKLVMILSGVNLLATIGIIVVLFLSFKKEASKPSVEDMVTQESHEPAHGGEEGHGEKKGHEEAKESHQQFGKMLALELFTVNLSTVGSVNPKYARVNISLEVPNTDVEGEVSQKMPQVRNAIIDLFNSKRPNDLASTEGRNYLKEEIMNALNSFLVTGKVSGVFFTSFAVSG